MFKHDMGALIWYMKDNRIHSAPVQARQYIVVENLHEDWASTKEQQALFNPFGRTMASVTYATIHGVFDEVDVAGSVEELIALLSASIPQQ